MTIKDLLIKFLHELKFVLIRDLFEAKSRFGFKLLIKKTDFSSLFFYSDDYEAEETKLISEIVKSGMTVLDIGGNIGYFTLLMANLVGKEGKIHTFEPNPPMYSRLEKNIKINPELDDGRITLHKIALSSKEGETIFYCPIEGHEGVGGLKNTKRASIEKEIKVNIETLDKFVLDNKINKIDFIKMDIEGGELDVLKGAEDTLKKIRPIILFEANEMNTAPYGYRVMDILYYFEERDYIIKKTGDDNFIAMPRN